MGRSGALLRQKKMQKVVYSFTKEQLIDHDLLVIEDYKKKHEEEIDEYFEEKRQELEQTVRAEWDRREELFKEGDSEDQFLNMLQYLLAVPTTVLCERFGWKPERPGHYDRRLNINKFADYIIDEIEKICDDETMDVTVYCEDAYQKYGVKFKTENME